MSWPTNPTNGQQTTQGNTLYQYNSTLGVWNKVQLTSPTFLTNGSTVTVSGNISAPGNITGAYILGNGSQLTGITSVSSYGNSNVATYLTSYTGNITANTIIASGNITAARLFGNGAGLTGITTSVVGNVTSSNVTYTAPFTNSVARTGNSKWADIINIKDFGAVGDGVADDTLAMQSALNTGKRVYIPTGTYRLSDQVSMYNTGQMVSGDGHSNSVFLIDNINYTFNLSATSVFIVASGEEAPIIRDIGMRFVQPVTSVRANLVNYPTAFMALNQPRFTIQDCKISGAMTGIDMRGNDGGASILGLEMCCYNAGVLIDGSLDTVRISRLQYWPFDIAGTANESIFFDSVNRGIVSGRCDDLKINSCLFINGGIQVELQTTVSGTTFGAITDTDFDTFASINMTGGNMSVVACYFTIGNAAYSPITVSGGYLRVESCEFEAAVTVNNAMIRQSGSSYYQMTNCTFRNSGPGGGYFNMSAGTAMISNCQFIVGANQNWTNPLVAVAGGRMTFIGNRASDKGTGTGNLIAVTTDNWNSICNNLGVGWGFSYPGGYTQMVVANNK